MCKPLPSYYYRVPTWIQNRPNYYRTVLWIERMKMPGVLRGQFERVALTTLIFGAIFYCKIGNPIKYYHQKTKSVDELLNNPYYKKYHVQSSTDDTQAPEAELDLGE